MSQAFLERFRQRFPLAVIDECDVFAEPLPDLHAETLEGKYLLMGGRDLPEDLLPRWKEVLTQVNRFQAADGVLISTPMWNFGLPYRLKHYFDVIMQPRHLFRYGPKGAEGLAKPRQAWVISTRGGDYGPGSPVQSWDHLEPHLRTMLGFIGITEVTFCNVQPLDAGTEDQARTILTRGLEQVARLPL
jgi:FMN-dependent NADH-azoreductase